MSNDSTKKPARDTSARTAPAKAPEALAATPLKQPVATRVPWNPLLAIAFAAILFYLAQIIGGLFLGIYPLLQHWNMAETQQWLTHSITGQFLYMLLSDILIIGGLAAFLRYYKVGFRMLGLTRFRSQDIWLGIAGFAAYFVLYGLLLSALTAFIPSLNITQKQEIGFQGAQGPLMLSMVFISLAVLPPLIEELLMRGFLFGSLRKYLPFVGATLITSLVFASAHLPEGGAAGPLWVAAIDTFILSLVLCYLREKTGRLWAGITIHMVKNTLAFITIFILHTH